MTLHRFLETSAIAATIAYTGLVGEPGRPRYCVFRPILIVHSARS